MAPQASDTVRVAQGPEALLVVVAARGNGTGVFVVVAAVVVRPVDIVPGERKGVVLLVVVWPEIVLVVVEEVVLAQLVLWVGLLERAVILRLALRGLLAVPGLVGLWETEVVVGVAVVLVVGQEWK